jgi:hypothetical protein
MTGLGVMEFGTDGCCVDEGEVYKRQAETPPSIRISRRTSS